MVSPDRSVGKDAKRRAREIGTVAGSRSRFRGAMRPNYEGVAKRRETRGLRSPGVLRAPRHAARRATSLCDQGSAPPGAPLQRFFTLGPRLRIPGPSYLPEDRSAMLLAH